MRLCSLLTAILFVASAAAQDMPLSQILIEGESWKPVATGYQSVRHLYADGAGGLWIEAVDRDGRTVFDQLGADGKTSSVERPERSLPRGGPAVVTRQGFRYTVEPERRTVTLHADGPARALELRDLVRPSCLALWSDHGTLVVGDAGGKHLWAFRIESDGKLSSGDRYYPLRTRPGRPDSGVTALTIDDKARLYACTDVGVQVFDPTGRLCGVLLNPTRTTPNAVVFSGAKDDVLFVASGGTVFGRKLQSTGVPVKPLEKSPK